MSKSEDIIYSSDYSSLDIWDRVINVKFTRENGDTITVRSDYEEVWNGNEVYFKTCQPKPEIRVQYVQYQRTLINVDIYITNLKIIEADGLDTTVSESTKMSQIASIGKKAQTGITNQPNEALSMRGNRIIKADIEMGYKGQFFNWARDWDRSKFSQEDAYKAFKDLRVPSNTGSSTLEKAFMNSFKNAIDSQLQFREIRRCSVAIEWAVNISNPPDRITQFHGYVGSVEAGFQPFALASIDCASQTGALGKIYKHDIIGGVDDEYSVIKDNVPRKDALSTALPGRKGSPFAFTKSGRTTYRNYFNGGDGFTYLEAYCFNFITRRFPKTEIPLKRNKAVERAVLKFYMAANQAEKGQSGKVENLAKQVEQDVYRVAYNYYPEYFNQTEDGYTLVTADDPATGKIAPSAKVVSDLEDQINDFLTKYYVGIRFTIDDLPAYRKAYESIRNTLLEAHGNKKRMSWWEAAANLKAPVEKKLSIQTEIKEMTSKKEESSKKIEIEYEYEYVQNNPLNIAQYVAALENGAFITGKTGDGSIIPLDAILVPDGTTSDVPLKDISRKTYIVPTQNISGSIHLKGADGKKITKAIPKRANKDGTGYEFDDVKTKVPVRVFAGYFEVRDAYMFGLPVLCSEGASKHFDKQIEKEDDVDIQFMGDEGEQIKWICETWGLQYYKLHNGGFFLHLASESARELTSQLFITDQSRSPFRIPAVYDVTLSPIRSLRMPFVGFLDPMTLVEWNCRTTIGKMISFYYQPNIGRNFFTVISSSVDFATVDDHNTMELKLVDAQYTDPKDLEKTTDPKRTHERMADNIAGDLTYMDCIIIPDKKMNTWQKIYNSPACHIPVKYLEAYNTGALYSARDSRPHTLDFFSIMAEFNPELFEQALKSKNFKDFRKRIDVKANRMFLGYKEDENNFPDIDYCLAAPELPTRQKRIYLRYPLLYGLGSYDSLKNENANLVLAYMNGAWSTIPKSTFNQSDDVGTSI